MDENLKRSVTIRKPTAEGLAGELLAILQSITADGKITNDEAAELHAWALANRKSELPATEFLLATLEAVLADGVITPAERAAIHKAVERVLPRELRTAAAAKRQALEAIARERLNAKRTEEKRYAREEREYAREEHERDRRIYHANFLVAGVSHEGRASVVERFLEPEHNVFLVRERTNQFDPNAILIRLGQGYDIGYVPRDVAAEVAKFLDAGCKQRAYCTKILTGRAIPLPVVQFDIYRPEAKVDGALTARQLPAPQTPPRATTSSGGGCASCGILVLGMCCLSFALMFFLTQ